MDRAATENAYRVMSVFVLARTWVLRSFALY